MTTTDDAQPPVEPAAAPLNRLAVLALVAAFLLPLVGIVAGHLALGQVARTGERGHGIALAGTVLGYVFAALTVAGIVAYVAGLMALAAL